MCLYEGSDQSVFASPTIIWLALVSLILSSLCNSFSLYKSSLAFGGRGGEGEEKDRGSQIKSRYPSQEGRYRYTTLYLHTMAMHVNNKK
jgi:hypothetical protein